MVRLRTVWCSHRSAGLQASLVAQRVVPLAPDEQQTARRTANVIGSVTYITIALGRSALL
jgi:hypothetical protein